MNLLRRRRKNKNKKSLKKYIIFLFSLVMTTFAWFTYNKVLNNSLDLHILGWDITYEIGGELQENPISVSPQHELYPGMSDQEIQIDIKNNGEVIVDLNYILSNIKILGIDYEINDPDLVVMEGENEEDDETYTLELAERNIEDGIITQDIIKNPEKYPFTIKVECTEELLANQTEGGYLKIIISWPESIEDDEETEEIDESEIKDQLDTKWGYDFAKYYSENPEGNAIQMTIEVNATQRLTALDLLEGEE